MSNALRRAANLSIDGALMDEAKAMKINLSRAAEVGIARAVAAEKARRWSEENADVVRGTNEYIAKHGLPLQKYRAF
ncbi:MAG: post-segregation antitoxin CcdA [Hyphomicrobiales bacterium]|jgi:antitoxin CcdA|nr:MAG: post-segregation antitoxin CcdA [Hyphomicrobiales bacterium]